MSDHDRIVLSATGESDLRSVLASDPAAVLMLIGVAQYKIRGFVGREAYTLGANETAIFAQSLKKALEAVTASIAADSDESGESSNMGWLWDIEEASPHQTPTLAARACRFLRQMIAAWNRPHALRDASRHDARLLLGVRTIRDGRMEVIFEHGVLFGTIARPERFDVSTKMWIRDMLQKALDAAEIKVAQLSMRK